MTEATEAAPPPDATPTDSPEATPKPKPRAGNRYRLFKDGQGDFRVFELYKGGDKAIPQGAMLPIADVPGFINTAAAIKFIKNSGSLLEGKQVMVFKGVDICSVDVQTVSKVEVKFKPKLLLEGSPDASTGEDGG